jgi:hypothetical protein
MAEEAEESQLAEEEAFKINEVLEFLKQKKFTDTYQTFLMELSLNSVRLLG